MPPRVLVIANQKGGVGKTTTAINLGTALAAIGCRTLIIDMDPQGNASTGLGIRRDDRQVTTYDLMAEDEEVHRAIVRTRVPGLDIVPSTVDLSGAELELIGVERRSYRLRDSLNRFFAHMDALDGKNGRSNAPEAEGYDYILIDCPPSLNLLTINALTAGHAVLVPLQCEFFALEGLSQLLRTIDLVKGSLNTALEIQGIVLTMYDKRNNLSEQVASDVREHMGGAVYDTVIPRNVRVSEAPSHGKPALLYDLKCAGSQAYIALARELIERESAVA
ncbi:MAG: ParA family protein [Alphaproteobacteria bacterium]